METISIQPEPALQVLRERVDRLEVRADEKDRPWYRKAESVAAVSALIISLASFVIGLAQQRREDNDHKLDQLETLASQLIDTNEKMIETPQDPANANQALNIISILNTRQAVLVSKALQLLNSHVKGVPSDLYFIFGSAESSLGHFSEAAALLKNVCPSEQQRGSTCAFADRDLGTIYMYPNLPITDLATGRKYYQHALDIIGPRNDPTSGMLRGGLDEAWGISELQADNVDPGQKEFDQAQKEFAALPASIPARSTQLAQLRQTRIVMFQGTTQAAHLSKKLLGKWGGTDSTSAPMSLSVTSGDDLSIHAEMHDGTADNPLMTVTYSGTLQAESSDTASFTWSTQANPPFGIPRTGITTLTLSSDDRSLDVSEVINQQQHRSFRLTRQ